MNRQLDVLFVEPNTRPLYGVLADNGISAIETPTWSLLLAESLRNQYGVAILDANAENLYPGEIVQRIVEANPRIVTFVVYSANPNGGSTNLACALPVAKSLKEISDIKVMFVGSHSSALPYDVLGHDYVDFVSLNEGVYSLRQLLDGNLKDYLEKVTGLGYKDNSGPHLNPGTVVPQDRMDIDLPGYAWDLLPYKNKPFDLYRAHNWHVGFDESLRTPFAALYTSLGCFKKCSFCMINSVNRTSNDLNVIGAHNNLMRFWSPTWVLNQFKKLTDYGVHTIRISDEMFFFNKKYYEPILNGLIDSGISEKLRTWTYSRCDTVNERFLELFRKAGVKWLALGIEAANQEIRSDITKGSFGNINIRDVIKQVRDAGIYVGANYIFGFENEKLSHLQETLDLALELNTENANFYTAAALPGSQLYQTAKEKGWHLPTNLAEYSFLGAECVPLPTNYLTSAEVLKFRDDAWHKYFTNPPYLDLIEKTFGLPQRKKVEEITKIKLKRKLLGD